MNSDEMDITSISTEVPEASDDEDSFVVLEPSSSISDHTLSASPPAEVLPLFRTNKVREMKSLISSEIAQINTQELEEPAVVGLDTIASSVAKIVISPESSYEEIQKQVEELIKDNEKLKNTIAHTNVNMKKQYTQFVAYKDDVTNVVKSYKEKFNEAKICIEKYKDENARLADEVEGYTDIKKLQEEEIMNLKKKIMKIEQPSFINVIEGESLVEKTDELQTELASAKLKMGEIEVEKIQLKEQIEELNNTITKLCEELKESSQKFSFLESQNVGLNAELTQKTQNIEKLNDKIGQAPKFEDQMRSKVEEINMLQFENGNLRGNVQKLEKENNDLKSRMNTILQLSDQHQETIKKHSEELSRIAALEQELKTAKLETESARQENVLLRTEIKKYAGVEEDCTQYRRQLSIAQQTITQLEIEHDKKVEEIEKLRKLLQDSENDEIFALKEQVELHKTDFEAERESKVTLKRERDQIAEDLKNLQKRNQQLQNEIETIRARNQPRPEGYNCPKCNFGFNSYQSLENHVHRCLDLEGFP